MYRLELAFAKNKGKIATLDLAQVPDHWDPDKWMYYAEVLGWAVKDSFKEANKGAATGKLAINTQAAQVLDLETGNYIQQHVMMLQFVEKQLGEIAGVSAQRQGQIENRELVGNVERAVTQSSHITEKWFGLHSTVKLKALTLLLETAKITFKEQKSQREQQQFEAQQQIEVAKIQEMKENREDLQAHELEKLDRQFIYDKELKQMEIDAKINEQFIDLNHNGTDDRLEQQKIENEKQLKERKLEHDKNIDRESVSITAKEKNEKSRLEEKKLQADKENKDKTLKLQKENQVKALKLQEEKQEK